MFWGDKQAVESKAQTNWHNKEPSNLNVTLNMEFFELFLDWAMKKWSANQMFNVNKL